MNKPKKLKKPLTQNEKMEKLMKNGSFLDKFMAGFSASFKATNAPILKSLGIKLKKGGSVKSKKKNNGN